jgi:hypothetical protein
VVTGIAVGLNFYRFGGVADGSPFINPYSFTPGPSSRIVWAAVLVIVALPVIALAIMTVSRPIALGLFTGLTTFVLATSLARLAIAYVNGGRHDAEGTWLFVSAGPALVALAAYHLFVREPAAITSRR